MKNTYPGPHVKVVGVLTTDKVGSGYEITKTARVRARVAGFVHRSPVGRRITRVQCQGNASFTFFVVKNVDKKNHNLLEE